MSVWKQMVERRLGAVESWDEARSHELNWHVQRLLDLERLVGELRSVTFPTLAREYLGKRVRYVGEGMTDNEILAAVRADIESKPAPAAWGKKRHL